jgi:hypothetical protein
MSGVFISYRRAENSRHAGRLFDRLSQRFPNSHVFMDVAGIEAGSDFVEVIQTALNTCNVMLVVIGREWLTCTDGNGSRRIDNSGDFVHLEILTALKRKLPVMCVLVNGGTMPTSEVLPDDLKELTEAPSFSVRDGQWDHDLQKLFVTLRRLLAPRAMTRNLFIMIASVATAVTAVVVLIMGTRGGVRPAEHRPEPIAVLGAETTFQASNSGATALATFPSRRIAFASAKSVTLFNPENGHADLTVETDGETPASIAELPDGRVAWGTRSGRIVVQQMHGKRDLILSGHTEPLVALLPLIQDRLASGSWDQTIRIWNLATGKNEATLQGHTQQVNAIAQLPDHRIASASADGSIWLWLVVGDSIRIQTLTSQGRVFTALAPLPNGDLASGSEEGEIEIWRVSNATIQTTLRGQHNSINALVVLPDGRLASGADDGTIRIWNLSTGKAEASLEGHAGRVTALVVLRDGRLASGSDDGTIRLWSVARPHRLEQ